MALFPLRNKDRPLLMGILNVTPDSFSDGGSFAKAAEAVDAGLRMMDEGADLIDVGGESTRPGATPITSDEELARVRAVIDELCRRNVLVSVDTSKAVVARAGLTSGAVMVNDVTALRDPEMASVCAEAQCHVVLMHMQGEPGTMQVNPTYGDVVREVKEFLVDRAASALAAGVAPGRIWIDPGIGFGKTTQHNLLLLKGLEALVGTGYPVLVGVSRKGFVGRLLASADGPLPVDQRIEGTLAAHVVAQLKGVGMIRAHDVRAARRAIDMAAAIQTV